MTESFRSIWEIKEAIKNEKLRTENISNSAKQWRLIGEEITSDSSNMTSSGHEWQIRYDCQHLYNGMLAKQIKRMRAELRMLRYGADLEMDTMDQRTIGELRTYIKHLQVEKWSLKSLKRMYERQIDAESMDYFRARDQLTQLIKDVKNCRQAWIRAQEKTDQEKLSFLEPPAKKTDLKPVAKIIPIISALSRKNCGASYSQRFQERSGNISQRGQNFHGPYS